MLPSLMYTKESAPRYLSYQLSNSSALNGLFLSTTGGGSLFMIASKTASIPMPNFAEIYVTKTNLCDKYGKIITHL